MGVRTGQGFRNALLRVEGRTTEGLIDQLGWWGARVIVSRPRSVADQPRRRCYRD